MKNSEKVNALYRDLQRVLDRYAAEFEMDLASILGTLDVIKHELITQVQSEIEDEE